MRLFAAALICVSCYSPNIPSGGFSCNASNNFACPDNLSCNAGTCQTPMSSVDAGILPPDVAGCSDGTREALTNVAKYQRIAACDGAWDQQGIVDATQGPHCNRNAGNTGTQSDGHGCAVADLCAVGWHVCNDAADASSNGGVAACAELAIGAPALYATRQRGAMLTGACVGVNLASDANNINGCGNGLGISFMVADMCAPLNRRLSASPAGQCPAPWNCGNDDHAEGFNVTQTGLQFGGVLCCHD